MTKRGKFIVVDGGDGAGKTTLLKLFAERNPNANVLLTREPGGTPYAEKIRELFISDEAKGASAETQFSIMFGARHDHITKKIKPALQKGGNVISDRFDSSTYAMEVEAEPAIWLEKLFWETRAVYLKDCEPDLYVFLDVKPEIALQRLDRRLGKRTHYDLRGLEFHKRVYVGFKKFLKHVPHKMIDGNQTVDKVYEDFHKIFLDLTQR